MSLGKRQKSTAAVKRFRAAHPHRIDYYPGKGIVALLRRHREGKGSLAETLDQLIVVAHRALSGNK
jgi:hypothetical protein